MNIVYKFTSKISGKFYVGSKTECEVINGKILDCKSGRYYYSSCKDEDFLSELRQGNLELEVLEENINRTKLLEKEAYWQHRFDYKSPDCWNKILATTLHPAFPDGLLDKDCNIFEEKHRDFIVRTSTISRLDASAIREGFSDNGRKMYFFLNEKEILGSFAALDKKYKRNKYFCRYLLNAKIEDFDKEVDLLKIKSLMREGASFVKACELCEVPHYVARYKFGKRFENILAREELIAEVNGFLSRDEFNLQVLKDFLSGVTRVEISKKYESLSISTVSRIIDSEVRERLKVNDLG